jgi:CHAT domain-containing protein/tetratricopeptide (TPR) repeat protein
MFPSRSFSLLCIFYLFCQQSLAQKTSIEALYIKAREQMKQEQYRPALASLQKIIEADSSEVNALYFKALVYGDLQQYDTASALMMQLSDKLPDYANPNLNAGWFALRNRDFENAKKYSLSASELQSENYVSHLNAGHACFLLGQPYEASYYYKLAAQYLPDSVALEKAKADFNLLVTEGLMKKNNGPALLQTYFNLFKPNTKANMLLDSIYRMVVVDQQDHLPEKIISLKARFIEAELTYPQKRWWVMRDFMWDVGADFYKKRNLSVAWSKYFVPLDEINFNTRDSIKQYLYIKKMVGLVRSSSDFKTALTYSKKQLAVAEEYHFSFQVISSLIGIGDAFNDLKLIDSSIAAFKRGLQLSEEAGDKRNAYLTSNRLYIAYGSTMQWDSMMHYYSYCMENFAASGVPGDALVSLLQDQARNAYEFKKYKEALSAGLSCLAQMNNLPVSDEEWANMHDIIGKTYFQLEQYPEAEKYLEKGLDYYQLYLQKKGIEQTNTLSPMRDKLETFSMLGRLLATKNNANKMFATSEKIKGNSLFYLLTGQAFPKNTLSLKQVQEQLKEDEAGFEFTTFGILSQGSSIAFESKARMLQIASANDWKKLVTELNLGSYRDSIIKVMEQVTGNAYGKNTNSIGEPTILALYHFYGIGHNNNLRLRSSLLPTTAIDSLMKMREEDKRKLGHLFYCFYFKPFESIMKGKKKLYICPDGILNYLPAELFINDEGKYLGELYDIIYVPSFTILDSIRRRKQSPIENVIAFGNPDYSLFKPENLNGRGVDLALIGFSNWAQLPGTEKELASIKTTIPQTLIYQQKNISETIIKTLDKRGELSKAGLIHFALHGIGTVQSNYEDISLIPSEPVGGSNDGFLQFSEIAALTINARLVCLSACESALGTINGEDNVNLSMAFMKAGANSVAATAWSISDEATSLFMAEVYKNIYQQKTGISEAFFLTRKKFINGDFGAIFKSPYYWAPFRYYGY